MWGWSAVAIPLGLQVSREAHVFRDRDPPTSPRRGGESLPRPPAAQHPLPTAGNSAPNKQALPRELCDLSQSSGTGRHSVRAEGQPVVSFFNITAPLRCN